MASKAGYQLTKLIAFMSKIIPDSDGITFFDDGKHLIIQMTAADSMTATATIPSNGNTIEPITLRRVEFTKPYRAGANLSGSNGKLTMSLNNWRMTLSGAVEVNEPKPYIVEGKKVVVDVNPLRSVPTEDNYGGATWALFLPEGVACLYTTYSLVSINLSAKSLPTKAVVMQANAIYPLVNLNDPELVVGNYIVGVSGNFPLSKEVDAKVHIALTKPNGDIPDITKVLSYIPSKDSRFSVKASELRTCIEGAKKTFEDTATNLTFVLGEDGISISLSSDSAELTEKIAYVKEPEKPKGRLRINSDILVNAFKGMRDLSNSNAIAHIKWDETAISIRITENKLPVGSITVAASE